MNVDGRLPAIAVLCGLIVLGYVVQLIRRGECGAEVEQLRAFRNVFVEWFNSGGSRQDHYQRLLKDSRAIQNLINASGERFDFRPPFSGYVIPHYQTVTNGIPAIGQAFRDSSNDTASQHAPLVDEALLRLEGHLELLDKRIARELRNPIVQFREGVRAILRFPTFVLGALGVSLWLPLRSVGAILSQVTAVVSFVAAVVTIIVGWDQLAQLLRSFLRLEV